MKPLLQGSDPFRVVGLVLVLALAMTQTASAQIVGEHPDHEHAGEETVAAGAGGEAATEATGSETPPTEELEEKMQQIVSLSFVDTPLGDILSGIAQSYGLNILTPPDLKGTVTISLVDVTLKEALKALLEQNEYLFLWEGNVIKVRKKEEVVVTRVIPVSYVKLDVAFEVAQKLASPDAYLRLNEANNEILVTDKVAKLDKIEDAVKKIDTPPLQVLIESKLLNISYTDLQSMGFTLQNIQDTKKFFELPSPAEGRTTDLKSTLANPTTDLPSGQITGTIQLHEGGSIVATIDALVRANKAKVLASPSIATLNNTEAKINIGEKFPITEQTQTTTGTTTTTRFVDVGITFTVKPRVGREGFITMFIHPEVSSVSATLTAGPRITTRYADTTVMVRDGETAVIAGLIEEEHNEVRGRNPFLSWFPFSVIFRNSARNIEQNELAIFITPHIIRYEKPAGSKDLWRSRTSELDDTSKRLVGAHYFDRAQRLEDDKTGISYGQDEPTRWRNAILAYGELLDRYPRHEKVPEAVWRMARLYEEKLRDPVRAREYYVKLSEEFPYSHFARDAWKEIERLERVVQKREAEFRKQEEEREKALEKKEKKKEKKEKKEKKVGDVEIPVSGAILIGGKTP